MGKAIMVTSFKGGVGKTTLSAGLATALQSSGKSVIAVDMDFGTRGLDIALGCENSLGSDILELISKKSEIGHALVETEREGLRFIASPGKFSMDDIIALKDRSICNIIRELKSRADYVIFDMPAGNSIFLSLFRGTGEIDHAIVVTTDDINSMRAAEKSAISLFHLGIGDIRLVINNFYLDRPENNLCSASEIIRQVSIPVIGIVPHEIGAERATWDGKTLFEIKKSPASSALANIARRLKGEEVPILDGILKRKKRLRFF